MEYFYQAQDMRTLVDAVKSLNPGDAKEPIYSLDSSSQGFQEDIETLLEDIYKLSLKGKSQIQRTFQISSIGYHGLFYILKYKLMELGYDVKYNSYDVIAVFYIKW